MLPFAIVSKTLPFEAHVIQYLTSHVILGRNFFQKCCSKVDFDDELMIQFKHWDNTFPFDDSDPVVVDSGDCSPWAEFVFSVHADSSFTIPPESEIILMGRLSAKLPLKRNVCGLMVPRNSMPHRRYLIFGPSELIKVTKDGTIPVRMVINLSARPVKIFRKTRLGDFESVEERIESFQVNEAPEKFTSSFKTKEKHSQADYLGFPDLSDSFLGEADKIKFRDLFQSYHIFFCFSAGDQLGKTSFVQHVTDTRSASLLSKGRIEPVRRVNRRLIAQ